ncbi:unannotated protein [freshwater metagenome]|uniref:Unannotated protein n=1 Tax=freshwater metagenome TaxID=449393 RepID=A0A6J7HGF3_9ZZZZ|nr:hypothetical protein [Actinomycetota bacterium]
MLLVLVVVLGSVAAGIAAERRHPAAALRMAQLLIQGAVYIILPVVTFFTVTHVHLTGGVGAGIAFGWAERLVAVLLAYLVGARLLRLPRPATGALMLAAALANTGYLGVPLITALMGDSHPQATGEALTYDVAVSAPAFVLIGFGIGAAFGRRAGTTVRERLRAFLLRNPPLVAFALALVAPHSWSPDWVYQGAKAGAIGLAPIGFFALGVFLMQEQEGGARVFPPRLTAPITAALLIRLVAAPAVMIGLALLVSGVPDAFLVQAAMPSGISALAIAHIYGLELRIVAGAVAWTTAVVLAAAVAVAALGGL